MPISRVVREDMEKSSWIRRMFEEGLRLKARFGEDRVFDFSLGNPDVEPPKAFGEAVARLIADPGLGTHGYMPNAGYLRVREAVARMVSLQQGLELGADNIVMSCGAAGGLNVLLKTILDPGDEVLVTSPYFAEYYFYARNHGGRLVPVEAGPGFALDPDRIRTALTSRTACVIVNSPNNPTGAVYSKVQLEGLAAVLREHGARSGRMPYLVSDEPYRDIVYGGAEVPAVLPIYEESIIASSWSKSLSLPGERIGYLAVSPRCAEAKELFGGMALSTRVLGFVNASALMQRAVAELLDERADVSSYARRRDLLASGLREAGYDFPDPAGAFYIFARVPPRAGNAESPDVDFVMHLKEYKVLGVPGVGFGCPGWFRLSFCVSERCIVEALPLFARALEDWKTGRRPA